MTGPTIRQLAREQLNALRDVPGYVEHCENLACERGGRQIYGRHVLVSFSTPRVDKDTRALVVRILRTYFCRSCRAFKFRRVCYQTDTATVRSEMVVLF